VAFENSRVALAEFDRGAPARDLLLDEASIYLDVKAWELIEKQATDAVRLAFYQDTREINSLSTCMIVDIAFIRRCVESEKDK
jgi:hypothetical protein